MIRSPLYTPLYKVHSRWISTERSTMSRRLAFLLHHAVSTGKLWYVLHLYVKFRFSFSIGFDFTHAECPGYCSCVCMISRRQMDLQSWRRYRSGFCCCLLNLTLSGIFALTNKANRLPRDRSEQMWLRLAMISKFCSHRHAITCASSVRHVAHMLDPPLMPTLTALFLSFVADLAG